MSCNAARRPVADAAMNKGTQRRTIVIVGGELVMVSTNDAWRASAAYLYVLGLDGASLAWEYLRRNPDYRRDWSLYSHDRDCIAKRWRLASLEDPGMDARVAQPLWQPEPAL